MENSKNKTDNFLKAIKKYADEQRSAMQTEVAQLKEEKLKEATEKGRHDSEKYIKDKLEESRNRQTGILAKKIQEGQKKLFLERAEMTESVFKKAEEKLVEYTKTSDYSNSLVKSAKEVAKLFADKGFCKAMNIVADETLDSKLYAQKEWFIENSGLSVL